MLDRVRAGQNPRSHLCGHEGRHVLQRNRRLSSRSAVLLVLRRLAKSNTDSPAAAETRHYYKEPIFLDMESVEISSETSEVKQRMLRQVIKTAVY